MRASADGRIGGMANTQALPRWQSHKVVEGFKIVCIVPDAPSLGGGTILHGYDVSTNTKL